MPAAPYLPPTFLDEPPPSPPRSWTSAILLARVLVLFGSAALVYHWLGPATLLAVVLVFWALFWAE